MKHTLAKIWRLLNLPKNVQLFIMRIANDEFLVGVTGVIVNDKDEVLLLKHTYRQTQWSLPGGYLQRGEHPVEGIEREVFEETALKVKIDKIIKTTHDHENARLDISGFGKFIGGTFVSSAEVIEYGFFAFEKLPDIGNRQKKLIAHTLKYQTKYQIATTDFLSRFSRWFKKR